MAEKSGNGPSYETATSYDELSDSDAQIVHRFALQGLGKLLKFLPDNHNLGTLVHQHMIDLREQWRTGRKGSKKK